MRLADINGTQASALDQVVEDPGLVLLAPVEANEAVPLGDKQPLVVPVPGLGTGKQSVQGRAEETRPGERLGKGVSFVQDQPLGRREVAQRTRLIVERVPIVALRLGRDAAVGEDVLARFCGGQLVGHDLLGASNSATLLATATKASLRR